MSLHFSRDEFAQRRARVIAAMNEAKLDGLLMFRQELPLIIRSHLQTVELS